MGCSKEMILFFVRHNILFFVQVVTNFADVPPSLMYDVLQDADYRKCWDDNMLECFEICQLDRYNDIGYYSSK